VTVTGPAVISKADGTLTTSCVAVCDWIDTAVAPKLTVDDALKFVPVIVTVVGGDSAGADDGESAVTVGAGF
jgi:hypothetical protein